MKQELLDGCRGRDWDVADLTGDAPGFGFRQPGGDPGSIPCRKVIVNGDPENFTGLPIVDIEVSIKVRIHFGLIDHMHYRDFEPAFEEGSDTLVHAWAKEVGDDYRKPALPMTAGVGAQ
jgi:hypothetical protein